MKAAQLTKYGKSDNVVVSDVPKPGVADDKILVEIYAAGVNPMDWKVREGYAKDWIPLILPATLGFDFAGVVSEIGDSVSGFEIGDEIYGQVKFTDGGSFAEFAQAQPGNISHKPKNLDFVEAAALPLAGTSAYQALVEHIGLERGQKILIHGGAGGIGTVSVQLAKHLGAYVATTVSGKDIDYARGLGADEVIDYATQKFEEIISDYDAVFDTVGGETYKKSFQVLKEGGVIVSMAEQPDQELVKQYGVKAIAQQTKVTTKRLEKLAELVEQGALKIHVDKVFPLEEADQALSYLQSGKPRGKVVVKIK